MNTARLVFIALLLAALGASGCTPGRAYRRELTWVSNYDPMGQEYGNWYNLTYDRACRDTLDNPGVSVFYRQCFDIDEWAALPAPVRRWHVAPRK